MVVNTVSTWRPVASIHARRPPSRNGSGQGIGSAMMRWAIENARERGCQRVQLTSNRRRVDAHRFYERLGFVPGYVGMKLTLA